MADKDAPPPAAYDFVLVARDTFMGHKKGDVIDDPSEIAKILNTHHESFVVKRAK